MNCEKYLVLIDDLIEGELDSENAGQVNSHLSSCPECDSSYAMLREEKEIYGRFLFDVEPPKALWNQFQTKIEAAPLSQNVEKSNNSFGWNFNLFNYFRLYPALGFAAVLLICAFGFWKFAPRKIVSNDEFAGKTEINVIQPEFSRTNESKPEIKPTKAGQTDEPNKLSKPTRIADKPKDLNRKASDKVVSRTPVKQIQSKEKEVLNNENQELQANNQLTEEQLQLKAIETETTQQIEKIELLLRSFRNARVVEGSTLYDVAYEKQQARRLLGKNVELRQIAEIYGALYTEELLDKAEPFLLDIANLDNNPLPEQILDIKERVKNQNIIASLQVY